VKLLDFGIARAEKVQREAHTTTGLVVGTMGYLSPDRITEEGATPASDVYALGCVLFVVLTGEKLFHQVDKQHVFKMAVHEKTHETFIDQRLRLLDDVAPPKLVALVESMLTWSPEDRLTAQEVAIKTEEMTPHLPGPTLRAWARVLDWPGVPPDSGEWEGLTIEDALASGVTRSQVIDTDPPKRRKALPILMGASMLFLAVLVPAAVGGMWALGAFTEPPAPVATLPPPVTPEPAPEPTIIVPPRVEEPAPITPPRPQPVQARARVEPKPEPEPVVVPVAMGTLAVEGQAPVELRSGDARHGPGALPAGEYEIWAKFGTWSKMGVARVGTGATVTVKCNKFTMNCVSR
jgi:serine/threonine-protein kinase